MNTLPEDIQIKIYKMAHQMRLMDVMSELISEFDYMCYLKAKKILKLQTFVPNASLTITEQDIIMLHMF